MQHAKNTSFNTVDDIFLFNFSYFMAKYSETLLGVTKIEVLMNIADFRIIVIS